VQDVTTGGKRPLGERPADLFAVWLELSAERIDLLGQPLADAGQVVRGDALEVVKVKQRAAPGAAERLAPGQDLTWGAGTGDGQAGTGGGVPHPEGLMGTWERYVD
jgi:hypothetical protein